MFCKTWWCRAIQYNEIRFTIRSSIWILDWRCCAVCDRCFEVIYLPRSSVPNDSVITVFKVNVRLFITVRPSCWPPANRRDERLSIAHHCSISLPQCWCSPSASAFLWRRRFLELPQFTSRLQAKLTAACCWWFTDFDPQNVVFCNIKTQAAHLGYDCLRITFCVVSIPSLC